jgi:serine/threonine protein kinase/tetratricopeptide (TPR) repeat protein
MPKPPSQLAEFEILRLLGAGGMAEVFLAKKRGAEGTYKLLVVKRILPIHGTSRRFRTMFVEEAQLATRLNHPNIVQVYDFSDHGDDGLLLSMEHVEGFDLGKLMVAAKQKGAKIPPLVSAFIVSEAARGLHYAHERKDEGGTPLAIVHRDVSPQNILLSHDGVVKIADFGIASANLFREEAGVLKGKFGYMSPEQARGERVDRCSDIYSLGVVLYEMLTLRSPYGRLDAEALLKAVQTGSFEPPSAHVPDVPPELEAIVLRSMARDKEARFQTARDMSGAIARVLLAKQELVDNASVETTLTHLVGRELPPPSPPPAAEAQPQTLAAVPLARSTSESADYGGAPKAVRVLREVRHVAVVTLRLQGLESLESMADPSAGHRSGGSIQAILDDIAFKRGALWSWEAKLAPVSGPSSSRWGDLGASRSVIARAIVGLLANPSRAAAEAASLAIDVHEALAGASEDLPVKLRAAIGIVRGIATGERDAQGHLIHHELKEPANFLADQLASRTPLGETWVAGGVYRLVRRDFRWRDAPSLEIRDPGEREIPRQMRLYALERPLTREERLDEVAIAPNDLVGRDAEKADLHAALHRAINPSVEGGYVQPDELAPPTHPSSMPPPLSTGEPFSMAPRGALSQRHSMSGSLSKSSPLSIPATLGRLAPATGPAKPLKGELAARAIVGEMGIGKTALVTTFLSELPGDIKVLSLECSPVTHEIAFATVSALLRIVTEMGLNNSIEEASDALRRLLGPAWAPSPRPDPAIAVISIRAPEPSVAAVSSHSSQSTARGAHSARIIARLAELITGKQRAHADDDAGSYRRELVVAGMRALLGTFAEVQPLVVVIDGLQWADRQSLELLQDLLKSTVALPILVLCLTRPEERVSPFIEGLVRIELRGLSAEEQMRLVEARLGVRRGVAAVCGELVPRVAGNPFLLLEMIEALLERGTLEIVERLPPASDGMEGPVSARGRLELVRHERPSDRGEALPSTLEQLIGDRIRELPSAEHDVVDWLAVAGGPLEEDDLLSLTRLSDDEAITRLCARGVCDRRGTSVDFRHPLARDVAYMALDRTARARMHRCLGKQLATTPLARGLSAAIVARHFHRGEDPLAAAQLYLEAAAAARTGHQAQLAERYYVRALKLLPAGDARRIVAHEALEAIYRHLGRRRDRRNHLSALRRLARESGQARWVALALVRTARLDLDEGYLARGLPIAQRAAEVTRLAQKPPLEVEALTILSEILRELGDIQGAIDAVERALKVAETGSINSRARAEVLRAKGVLLRYGGRVEEAVEAYAEAIAVFKAVGARRAEARVKNALAFAMYVLERFEDAIAVGLSSHSIDVAIGGRFQIAKTLSTIGQAYARAGDLPEGLTYLKKARDAHEKYGDQDSRADTLLCTAGILLESGDVDAAHTLTGDAGALIAVTGSVYDLAHERILRALLALYAGETSSAIPHASEARRLSEAQGLVSYHTYATAIEALARVDAGELHSGVLLARTALGAVQTNASEYGLEVRALACEALRKGAPSSARDAANRAVGHVRKIRSHLRDARLGALFVRRPIVARLLDEARALGVEFDVEQWRTAGAAACQPALSPFESVE